MERVIANGARSVIVRDDLIEAIAGATILDDRLTLRDLLDLGVVDRVIPEPGGGAHRDAKKTIESVGKAISALLKELKKKDGAALVKDRRQKFLKMGSKGLAA